MKADKIRLEYAKPEKLFYFVANVVIWRATDGRCLILKRSETEAVHPGKYCVPGGKLEWRDLPLMHPTRMNGDVVDFERVAEDLLRREVREEAGISIGDELRYLNSVAFVRPDGIPVVLVKFAARYLSGMVSLESGSFVDHAWVNIEEVAKYNCILGIPEEIKTTIELFK